MESDISLTRLGAVECEFRVRDIGPVGGRLSSSVPVHRRTVARFACKTALFLKSVETVGHSALANWPIDPSATSNRTADARRPKVPRW